MTASSTPPYKVWAPPRVYSPPPSATPSPSKSTSSGSDSEQGSPHETVSTLSTSSSIPSPGPLWYDDRLVIFHTGGLRWKLPHNPFSQKSFVLRDFLASPFNNSVYFDHDIDAESGLQMIELLEVDDKEGDAFLMALYNSEFFERPFISEESSSLISTSLDTVLAVLKLSTRYQIQFLRKRALAHLSLAYPVSLDNWDRRRSRANFPLTSVGSDSNSLYYATPTETLKVIKTAYECEAPWILPSVLYECCKYDMESLIGNQMFIDGTIDAEFQIKVLVGFTEQKELATKEVLSFLRIPSVIAKQAGCSQLHKCADARMETLETALTWVLQWPLEVWSEQSWDDEQTRVMCRACRRICSEALQEGRKRVWERLPEIFRLPSWKSMEELMEKENL